MTETSAAADDADQAGAGAIYPVVLNAAQVTTVRMLADRAGVPPQVIVQRMVTAAPLRQAVAYATDDWTTTCPETGKFIPADMTTSRDEWFCNVLAYIGLEHNPTSEFWADVARALKDVGEPDG